MQSVEKLLLPRSVIVSATKRVQVESMPELPVNSTSSSGKYIAPEKKDDASPLILWEVLFDLDPQKRMPG